MGSCSGKIGDVELEAQMTPEMLAFHLKNINLYSKDVKKKLNSKVIDSLINYGLDKPKLERQDGYYKTPAGDLTATGQNLQ